MDWNGVFGVLGPPAMLGWLVLILAPRGIWWINLLPRLAIPLGLSGLYTGLILGFFQQSGGGFGSIAEVRALFASDPVLVAGWAHYLAFDLLIGCFLAARLDAAGVGRIIQAPILVMTFLFGPAGFVLGMLTEVGMRGRLQAHRLGVEKP